MLFFIHLEEQYNTYADLNFELYETGKAKFYRGVTLSAELFRDQSVSDLSQCFWKVQR